MRVLFLGSAGFALKSLDALTHSEHRLAAILSQPDRPRGRGSRLCPTPVSEWALDRRVPLLRPLRVSDPETLDVCAQCQAEVLVCVAYGQRIPQVLLDLFPAAGVNLHPSLLPRHRGPAPIPWTILSGDAQSGVTVIRIAQEMDAGAILGQETVALGGRETAGRLEEILSVMGAQILVSCLDRLALGQGQFAEQDPAGVSLSPKIQREQTMIDWSQNAVAIDRWIRALAPTPGAKTWHRLREVRLLDASPSEDDLIWGAPGEVLEVGTLGCWVATGRGRLCLTRVHPANGREMDACSYARGNDLRPGQSLGGREGVSPG